MNADCVELDSTASETLTSETIISTNLQFETPENVLLNHRPAGPGTRFIAWFTDQIFLLLLMLVTGILLIILGVTFEETLRTELRELVRYFDSEGDVDPRSAIMVAIGVFLLVWGLGSFVYFTASELFMRGQTPGKRMCQIRVVNLAGFSLNAGSVFLRNIFRVADNLPFLWIVPVLSSRGQRLGDMVAGTCVVSDVVEALSEVRSELSDRKAIDGTFRFDFGKLSKLMPTDFEAVERILDRWESLSEVQRRELLDKVVPSLCRKLEMEEPAQTQRLTFLEDLLSAEYRRQDRKLR